VFAEWSASREKGQTIADLRSVWASLFGCLCACGAASELAQYESLGWLIFTANESRHLVHWLPQFQTSNSSTFSPLFFFFCAAELAINPRQTHSFTFFSSGQNEEARLFEFIP